MVCDKKKKMSKRLKENIKRPVIHRADADKKLGRTELGKKLSRSMDL